MRATDRLPFREGVVVNRPVKDGHGSLVNVGLQKEVSIDKRLKAGTRVTVKLTYKDKYGTRLCCGYEPQLNNTLIHPV